ncbi:MAG: methane monooxygenase [Altererythrobacter sp. XM-24bin4]|uniref:2Fe-2S iron-sulfur cluster binding domain-containing protein n=1 Tax=uncultured Altererythrobacter sp. TaxID=500840 RepID=UPI000D79512D|nr:2Fe-2S iron-sulfur cluster binding domain-containing protein [uncultured Altererythrobacter sp.]PWL25488.1 MAG: methane monooxygenase [Altererythrobacter sp. XM-24bin4]
MSTPTRVLVEFSDGAESEVLVRADQSVLDAALTADVPILNQCQTGSCGSCIARLLDGKAEHRNGAAGSLIPGERAEGYRLLCLTRPDGECRFSLGYDSTAGKNRPVEAKCFVNKVDRIACNVVRLELELAEGYWMDFRPGQFIQVKVPGTEEFRSYSMATTAADLPRIELLIRILDDGAMSKWLTSMAKPDDVIEISGPYGQFFLKEKVRAPHIMIAGGTGLAPMMSMLDALRQAPGRKPRTVLSFGCQTRDALFALEQLDLRRQWMPALETRICVDRGDAADGIRIGNPVEAITSNDELSPDSVAYLCGPPGMIAAARQHLEGLGLPPESIFAEQFVASN